jgi:hypothetical protein
VHEPAQALLGGLEPQRVGVHPAQHPPHASGDRPWCLTQYRRVDQGLDRRARRRARVAKLGGDDRGPPGVQVPGTHRGQGDRQLGGQCGGGLHLVSGCDEPHREHRPQAVRRELTDMTQAMVHIDEGPRGVLLLVAAGVLRHPQRLNRRGRVDHLLRAIDLAGQVHRR